MFQNSYTCAFSTLLLFYTSVVAYFLFTELKFNFTTTLIERVHVNATTPAGLEIEFDVTLPGVSCALLNVDANDPTGQRQSLHLDKRHHVWKHRINKKGQVIDRTRIELGSTLLTEDHLREKALEAGAVDEEDMEDENAACGSCYGAGEDGECCNACDDVKRAYARRGWTLPSVQNITQCAHEHSSKEEDGEGCNVHGIVALSTGGGNLHLAPSHDMEEFGSGKPFSIIDVFIRTFEQFNVSHTIHKLRFGAEYPGNVNQLDGEVRTIEDGFGMYQYYFQVRRESCANIDTLEPSHVIYYHYFFTQVVPTLFRFLNGTTIQTNQYSVTEHMRHVTPGSNRGLPGVFFFYEVSSLHVEIEEYRRGWIQFFTSVCAIVGGVVTVMGLLDQYIYVKAGHGNRQLVR